MATAIDGGRLVSEIATASVGIGEASRLRMQTIIRLRWIGVGGQLFTVAAAHWWFGFDFPVGWCLALIAASAWLNVYLRIGYPGRHRLSQGFATALLAYDAAELAGLLYLTGGLTNPFAFLIVAPVTVSAATLPAVNTMALGVLSLLASTALIFWHLPLPWWPGANLTLPVLYQLGTLASIGSGMVFLALYAGRLTKESRQMSAALAATELVLAREQKLHALDGLAAAAAHELGTPLATIVLITKELESSKHKWPEIADDIELLRSQAARCREILRTLTRSPGAQDDPHHVSLPVTQLLQEAAMPHANPVIKLEISAHPLEPQSDTSNREPIAIRRPGVIYGLSNIVENAADFAQSKVEVQARWTDRELVITIADDGPGFAPDIIDTLGEPYVTTRPSGKRLGRSGNEASGLGLGFFIAKTLLERSGARIALENRLAPAHGAVVRISWPRTAFDLVPSPSDQADHDAASAYA